MKKIIMSLSVIAFVAAIAIVGTTAYFSDTETSAGNIMEAGVIDIVVDGQNPWHEEYSAELSDMKPCQTRWIGFTVRNAVHSNPINLWKHIDIIEQNDGWITEPECEEGGGTWTANAMPCHTGENCCSESYEPRNNLAAYTIYDMWVCYNPGANRCIVDSVTGEPSYGGNWIPIIKEEQFVRLDNVSSAWIELGQLGIGEELMVVQSYHLRSWPYAAEPEVTNWAQGDQLIFDIDLMATQLNGPGPKGYFAELKMVGKDPITWVEVAGASGLLKYNTAGHTFDYDFSGSGLNNIEYCLIYYADPWPGNNPGSLIAKGTAAGGSLSLVGQHNFGYDLPNASDTNAPAGAKIWLVPCADYDQTGYKMTAWSASTYLFEEQLISYDDTDN